MKRLLLFALLMVASAVASAQTTCPMLSSEPSVPLDEVRITWQRPATYSDNVTPLPADIQIVYSVYRGSGTELELLCVATDTTGTSLADVYRVTARIGTGPEGPLSIPIVVGVVPPVGPLNAAANSLVFQLVQTADNLGTLQVGRVAATVECKTEGVVVEGLSYYVVPRASIAWFGNVQPQVVYALCE